MAPMMATKRLRRELIKLQTDPPPGVIAEPDETNILKWFYAIRGPSDTSFDSGVYVGKLVFPSEYPMKAPSIYMLTPSGRFQTNTKICMSMSDFHPESWNPMWSVATIIQGVQSFMASDELTTGGLKAPESEQKSLARASLDYNRKMFPNLFGGDILAALLAADEVRKSAEQETIRSGGTANATDVATSSSRWARRLATAGASSKTEQTEPADKAANGTGNDAEEENDEDESAEGPKELSAQEIEKRRKKNAKKRAKQKANKPRVTQQQPSGEEDGNEVERDSCDPNE